IAEHWVGQDAHAVALYEYGAVAQPRHPETRRRHGSRPRLQRALHGDRPGGLAVLSAEEELPEDRQGAALDAWGHPRSVPKRAALVLLGRKHTLATQPFRTRHASMLATAPGRRKGRTSSTAVS